MNCLKNANEQAELLLAYTDGSLAAAERAACEAHLAACPACRALLEEHQELRAALEAWEAPAVSANFDTRLMAHIRAEEARPFLWRLPVWGWRWGFAAIPALVMALMIFLWPGPSPKPLSVAEIEEIETSLEDLEALLALQELKDGEAEAL